MRSTWHIISQKDGTILLIRPRDCNDAFFSNVLSAIACSSLAKLPSAPQSVAPSLARSFCVKYLSCCISPSGAKNVDSISIDSARHQTPSLFFAHQLAFMPIVASICLTVPCATEGWLQKHAIIARKLFSAEASLRGSLSMLMTSAHETAIMPSVEIDLPHASYLFYRSFYNLRTSTNLSATIGGSVVTNSTFMVYSDRVVIEH